MVPGASLRLLAGSVLVKVARALGLLRVLQVLRIT